MAANLEEILISVWRQAMVEEAKTVSVDGGSFPVRRRAGRDCAKWIFVSKVNNCAGLEQNPETASRWAQLAREGQKVMQFLSEQRYIAVVVDGKVQFYGKAARGDRK